LAQSPTDGSALRSWIEAYQGTSPVPPLPGEKRLPRRRYILFLIAALLVLISFVALLWRDWVIFQASSQRVVELRDALLQQDQFLALLVNAESGQRGYLLTGKPRDLQPYLDAVAQYPGMVARLKATPSSVLYPEEVRHLVELSGDKMAKMRQSVELAQLGNRDLAIRMAQSDEGPSVMAGLRALTRSVRDRQFQDLVAGNLEVERRRANETALQLLGVMSLVIFLLLALIDISRAGRVRDRSLAEITRMNEELLQVSSVASHDLKEPLRTIDNFSQLLERRYTGKLLDQTAADYLDVIKTSATRSYRLVDALQRFSAPIRAVHGRDAVADAGVALKSVLQSLRSKIAETGADVVVGEVSALVRLENGLLEQLFQNLLENAMKYRSQARPRIEINAHLDSPMWVFTVRDNGIGFDPLFNQRVFGLFQRLHDDDYPGIGLGLATCKKIVESTGGRIWADSKPGEGAVFSFTLPVPQRSGRRPAAMAAESQT
jgi:signal transduction histidine kinase